MGIESEAGHSLAGKKVFCQQSRSWRQVQTCQGGQGNRRPALFEIRIQVSQVHEISMGILLQTIDLGTPS